MVLVAAGVTATPGRDPYSVLLLVSDDRNDWIGCLGGHPDAITPHLDRLAEGPSVDSLDRADKE